MSPSMLDEISTAARTVAERVGPTVVAIGRDARGTGVVIAAGQVLTNAHNLRDRTTSVTFADGRSVQASVAGVDADGDLAVLTVDTGGALPLEWTESALSTGSPVLAATRGHRGLRVTFGLVSATEQAFRGPGGRRITEAVEHTAPLARGASGGPLVDPDGRLVGLNTHRLRDGFYLALPADADLRRRVDALAAGQAPVRRRLGVALAPAGVAKRMRRSVGLPERDGLLVRGVESGGPAARAGVEAGDLLVTAEGRPLTEPDQLAEALDGLEGDSVSLQVVRGVEERSVQVSFTEEAATEDGSA